MNKHQANWAKQYVVIYQIREAGKVKDKLENIQAKKGPYLVYSNQYSSKPDFEITGFEYVLKVVYFQMCNCCPS